MKRWIFAASWIFATSCRTPSPATTETSLSSTNPASPQLCVAIRGNGHYIATHFGAVARIVEDIGWIDAVAGGSSGSISSFLYESMRLNPNLQDCAGCEGEEGRARLALLLKSTRGLIEGAQKSRESIAVQGLVAEVKRLQQQVSAVKPADAVAMARDILSIMHGSTLVEVINWELFGLLLNAGEQSVQQWTAADIDQLLKQPDRLRELLQSNPKLAYAIDQIKKAFATFGAFKADNQEIFFRPGVVDFYAFTEVIGRVGDFYAGRGPYDREEMERFLSTCSAAAAGNPWSAFVATEAGKACNGRFQTIITRYFSEHPRERLPDSRLNDPIGKRIPALVSTSIIDGESDLRQVTESQERYWQQKTPDFRLDFARIRAGHWGPKGLSEAVCAKVRTAGDDKARRCLPLGEEPWAKILPFSPAEPGLARIQPLTSGARASAGGWIDLAPTQVLAAAGCRDIIYVTRRNAESPFVTGVARQLNMDRGDDSKKAERTLFDLDNAESSFSRSLKSAGAVWCTDWNSFGDFEVDNMMDESYCSEVVLIKPDFPLGPYSRSQVITDPVLGCTPGAPASAKPLSRELCGKRRKPIANR